MGRKSRRSGRSRSRSRVRKDEPRNIPTPPTPPRSSCSSDGEEEDTGRPRERLLMRNWLKQQLDTRDIPGFKWKDEEKGTFEIPWKHAARQGWEEEQDAELFRRWAMHTGKFTHDKDKTCAKRWKANFRCAINSLPDVEEVKGESKGKGVNATKVYRFLTAKEHRRSTRVVQGELSKMRKLMQPSRRRQQKRETLNTSREKVDVPTLSPASSERVHTETPLPAVSSLLRSQTTEGFHNDHSYYNPEQIMSPEQEMNHMTGGKVMVIRRSSTCSLPHSPDNDSSFPYLPPSPLSDDSSQIEDQEFLNFIFQLETGQVELEISDNNSDVYSDSLNVGGNAMNNMDGCTYNIPNLQIHIPLESL